VPYCFGETQLRVVHALLTDHRELLANCRVLILEHVLPTTAEFVRLMKRVGVDVHCLIAKPYSISQEALEAITKLNVPVIVKSSYQEIEDQEVVDHQLQDAKNKSQLDGKRIVIIDVGGYFAKALSKDSDQVAGVVEDTTFGHNRYKQTAQNIGVPILSVARSELKQIEARFVGRDAIAAMDLMLRDVGVSISGRNALVIGYGMIGSNVARTLRRYDLRVFVYDIMDRRNLRAHADGFSVHTKQELLKKADIIFSATGSEAISGKCAISFKEIEDYCKHKLDLESRNSR
jgi:adenosylhomocysteinase